MRRAVVNLTLNPISFFFFFQNPPVSFEGQFPVFLAVTSASFPPLSRYGLIQCAAAVHAGGCRVFNCIHATLGEIYLNPPMGAQSVITGQKL